MLPKVYHYLAAPAAELLDKMGSNFSTFAEIYFCSVPGFAYIFFLNLNTSKSVFTFPPFPYSKTYSLKQLLALFIQREESFCFVYPLADQCKVEFFCRFFLEFRYGIAFNQDKSQEGNLYTQYISKQQLHCLTVSYSFLHELSKKPKVDFTSFYPFAINIKIHRKYLYSKYLHTYYFIHIET